MTRPALAVPAAVFAAISATTALAQEPDTISAAKLPAPIRALHSCAAARDEVDLSKERFAKAVLFFVTCPAKGGAPESVMVYWARDLKAAGAKRIVFPVLLPDGKDGQVDALPNATPAREMDGDKSKNDPPWVTGTWEPKDRAGICMINGQWRLNGEKAELFLWDEAKECSRSDGPDYESRLDRKPPPLVGP